LRDDPVSPNDTAALTDVSFGDTFAAVIKSYKNRITEQVARGEHPKGFPADLVKVARRKLGYLNAAVDLNDLRAPPGNRLEKLVGDPALDPDQRSIPDLLRLDRGRSQGG
jgi:plasmid maintenance system killer protein